MKHALLILMLCCCIAHAKSQDTRELRKLISDMIEAKAEQNLMDMDYEEMINELIDLAQNPINLNKTSKEELEQLFFLSDFQIENILFYHYNNGPLLSIYELQAVEDLDSLSIVYMQPFVSVYAPTNEKRKYTNGQVLARYQSLIQTPMGYYAANDSTDAAYAGSKERWMTKARININGQIEAGFTLEKDPGEKAFPNWPPLTDFSSAYLQINNPIKYIEKVIVGDYRISFGQGLGMWTDMAFSKSTETAQLRRRAKGISKYTSVNESSYLRGIALDLKLRKFKLSPFISHKKIDASINLATDHFDEMVTSIQETGYHRTRSEIENRHSINETILGANLNYKHHLFNLDAGYYNWQINTPIQEKNHIKDIYRFKGDELSSFWLAHSVFLKKLTLFGELNWHHNTNWGMYQGATFRAGSDVIATLAYRKFSKGYTNILSNPFAESSNPAGESGIYSSIQFKPSYKLQIKAFADLFSYDWLRYNVYSPSVGFEWFAQANYRINYQNSIYLRYKSTKKEINSKTELSNYKIEDYQKQNLRLFYSFTPNEQWSYQTQVEYAHFHQNKKSEGWLFFQDLQYDMNRYFRFSIRYTLFDIEDYNSRIYAYEPDVLYAFNIPAYMDKGTRIILNAQIKPAKNLNLWLRWAHSNYKNKAFIGSGHQMINGNKMDEIKCQLQYRF
ncbi:helix-hairpin-helix domain-containing protein [Carboxylicivirga sp. N1Y90]|uniref:helix-hairpin-helix domain-containing protein n=1 Tax=Carboxylicivirga fragile TaxID=3417571 RepID=UPI003D33A4E0|nr:helix-hairpin-helix domain-containing protein [Marinilabiliaceae bacterium N1Y90]